MAFALGRQLGNAVTRNRLRRRLRAILNHHDHDLAPGLLLIGATPQAIGVGYARLDAAATEVLSAAEVLGAGVPDGASAASVEPAP